MRIASVRSIITRSRATGNLLAAGGAVSAPRSVVPVSSILRRSAKVIGRAQKLNQALRLNRLREMVIKAGGPGASLVAVLAPACDGDQLVTGDAGSASRIFCATS
jgi:hypothetical protein